MSISLAIIAGNVERYIERFLTSFAPLVDEIVIVRAIGFQDADRTIETAREVIHRINQERRTKNQEPTKFQTATYTNKLSHTDWPHVDDFAAARQMSFELASGDWIMWADTDDVITPESIRIIRQHLDAIEQMPNAAEIDGAWLRYSVPDDGISVFRERIIRRGRARWVFPIHENLEFSGPAAPGGTLAHIGGAEIVHAPMESRAPNNERNLRILRSLPEDQLTRSQRFHMFQSLRATGNVEDSIRYATQVIHDPGTSAAERYELLVSLAQISPDPATRKHLFLQAIATDPTRREAYGELVLASLADGCLVASLGWARSMLAHPAPMEHEWNARRKYYGWLAPLLHGMALRANNQTLTADTVEFNHFKAHGAKISLLHATRGRAAQANALKFKWLDLAADPSSVEHIFAIDADDESSFGLCAGRHVVVQSGGGCVRAWNAAAAMSRGGVLVQLSDDWIPPRGWDQIILERIGDPTQPAVLAISDGHRKDALLCMAILTRARYEQQGWLFHPDFEAAAMFSDNYFTDRAYRDNVVIEARDIIFEHQHPAFDPAVPVDDTYAAQNAPEKYEKGKAIFDRITKNQERAPTTVHPHPGHLEPSHAGGGAPARDRAPDRRSPGPQHRAPRAAG